MKGSIKIELEFDDHWFRNDKEKKMFKNFSEEERKNWLFHIFRVFLTKENFIIKYKKNERKIKS